MGVKINESRQNELSRSVEYAQAAGGRDIRVDCFYFSKSDPDIALPAQSLTRIELLAAFDDEIEFVVWSHRGANRCA